MVLVIVANSREILHNRDVEALQDLLGADTRELQDLWRLQSPSRENNLFVSLNYTLGTVTTLCNLIND